MTNGIASPVEIYVEISRGGGGAGREDKRDG